MSIRSARSKSERDGMGLACLAASWLALLAAPAARSDTITLLDFSLFKQAYLCAAGSACYDPRVDYDSNGRVGFEDFRYFKENVGRDLTPPAVRIESPMPGQILSGQGFITVSATDDVAVAGVSIFFEGMDPYPSPLTGTLYRVPLDTRTIPNGRQVISANAVDAAGNRSTHRVAVLINNPMP